jgi:hypothetical protein
VLAAVRERILTPENVAYAVERIREGLVAERLALERQLVHAPAPIDPLVLPPQIKFWFEEIGAAFSKSPEGARRAFETPWGTGGCAWGRIPSGASESRESSICPRFQQPPRAITTPGGHVW